MQKDSFCLIDRKGRFINLQVKVHEKRFTSKTVMVFIDICKEKKI